MADSYPERRYVLALERGGEWELTGIYRLRDFPAVSAPWEALPKADMDALRRAVALLAVWRNEVNDLDHDDLVRVVKDLCDAFDAIPPAFLATLEKP